MRLIAASGSLAVLNTPKLSASPQQRRPSGPAGCGSATWLASASSRIFLSLASVALASAFSIANVMLGPFDVCAIFLEMKAAFVLEPVHDRVAAGGRPA